MTIIEQIEKIKANGKKSKLLLHVCCAPCATAVFEQLNEYFEIDVFFYNPNIIPTDEFNLRLEALKLLLKEYPLINLICPMQDEHEFLIEIKGLEYEIEGGKRCENCISLRLKKTAEFMKDATDTTYHFFASTLSISPHKNADLINNIGKNLEEKFGTSYLSSNFKKNNGYLKSIEITKALNLYRQTYCGCKFE